MKKLLNRKGVIALITMLVLMGVGVLGIAMVITSRLNTTSADNYRYKIKTYCAADGLLTLMAQDVLDFNESHYDIGGTTVVFVEAENMTLSGSYQKEANAVASNGNLVKGTTAGVKWTGAINFSGMTGTYNVNVTYFDESDGKSTFKVFVNNVQVDTWVADQNTSGSANADATTIRVRTISDVLITNGVQVRVEGTPESNEWARVDCIQFVPFKSFIDTIKVGKDSISVIYGISQLGSDLFSMSTDAYILRGAIITHNYETHLTQTLSRETSGQWHETVHDSAYLPVTFYEFRADMSNPEFNSGTLGNRDMLTKQMVKDALDAQRKPVPDTNKALRTCILAKYDPNWYHLSAAQRLSIYNNSAGTAADTTAFAACTTQKHQRWCFSDSLKWWFRPRGGTGATFDSLINVWSNLKHRPKYNNANHVWSDSVASEYVGVNYDSTDTFANIVIYDTLKFRETGTNTGIFTFGDPANVKTKDMKWFSSNDSWNTYQFMPLQSKGYGFDGAVRWCCYCDANNKPIAATATKLNFAFTMEMHRMFTYKPGQTFDFKGDDDVWVFINNHLAIDLGGIHQSFEELVNLDTIGTHISAPLVSGQDYWFDFFYCERNVCSSDILITTNMMFFIPPQPLKRSWKRDYGNLD